MMPRSRTIFRFLESDWELFKKVCNKRWKNIAPNLLDGKTMSTNRLLGSGYYGLVMKTTEKKLVVKVSSDRDEGFFNQLVLTDPYLRSSKGLPFIFDCFHIPEWSAYVILRENVRYGLETLPSSSPLARSIPILDTFGERTMRIEQDLTDILNSLQKPTSSIHKDEFIMVFKEAKGLVRSEIIKAYKKLPHTSKSSKYHASMGVLKHALDKYGIALWDLHEDNLGSHQYDMREFSDLAPPLDKKCVLILDVGGNFGSPIMSQMIDDIVF